MTLEAPWTEEKLQDFVRTRLSPRKLVVVSNREPYMHVEADGHIRCVRPAGGLTFALDPILRAVGGTWIASGSGTADREASDEMGRVRVPPDKPRYTLRRVWLTKEEEEGYYFGFANSGLWPLCHVAYIRPTFQREHWEQYTAVNRKYAQIIREEIGDEPALVFVQDYHFALLPRMLRREVPRAIVAQFWHIPWPNPEVFRICPWKRELIDGLLGNHVLGFQTQYQCNNFLDMIDREIEARADRERFVVSCREQETHVRPFPISVDFDGISARAESPETEREMIDLRRRYRLDGKRIALGVDRIDYTKGIPERLQAVDRMLQRNPHYREKFVLVQAGPASRTRIPQYAKLVDEIEGMVDEINWRHQTGRWRPIVLIEDNLPPETVTALFRLTDVCLVTSLHDGMNLVAKEFVAGRSDRRGALILSQFAGASRELEEAIRVNPFAVDELADALHTALEMLPEDQERCMIRLRERVRESNVFRWAATILEEAIRCGNA